jgi:hypothetical protein
MSEHVHVGGQERDAELEENVYGGGQIKAETCAEENVECSSSGAPIADTKSAVTFPSPAAHSITVN